MLNRSFPFQLGLSNGPDTDWLFQTTGQVVQWRIAWPILGLRSKSIPRLVSSQSGYWFLGGREFCCIPVQGNQWASGWPILFHRPWMVLFRVEMSQFRFLSVGRGLPVSLALQYSIPASQGCSFSDSCRLVNLSW